MSLPAADPNAKAKLLVLQAVARRHAARGELLGQAMHTCALADATQALSGKLLTCRCGGAASCWDFERDSFVHLVAPAPMLCTRSADLTFPAGAWMH